MIQIDPCHVVRRFGFGQRGTQAVPTDPVGWYKAQLNTPDPLLAQPGPSTRNTALVDRVHLEAEKVMTDLPGGLAPLFGSESAALLRHAVMTDMPVRERLVWFWANHFAVSERAGNRAMGLIGAYVREAIRPHVTGRFEDLARAVMRHPAMLYYLDGASSVGPNSVVGVKERRGLNENLAREFLELHTLGVESGYTQRDVTSFAAILTGRWVQWDGDSPGFVFRADMHEPGPKVFMGVKIPPGFEGSESALTWVANHPATRRHIATQMARHFIADTPPPRCVAALESVLKDTGGDLKQAMLALFAMEETHVPLTKFRTPAEYVVAVERALALPIQDGHELFGPCNELGQRFLSPLLPNGWPDTADDWLAGEPLLKRFDWAMTRTSRANGLDPDAIIEANFGSRCSQPTRAAIKACPNRAEALATLFASPEFLRR